MPVLAAAQPVDFRRLTIEDGLSQNAVYAVSQDRQGFLWFGTKDGLNRYDGYTFTVFQHNPFDTTTLSDHHITKLFEDPGGGLWIGAQSGALNYYRQDTETFERIQLPSAPASSSPAAFEISALAGSAEGTLWVGTRGNGLFRLSYAPDALPACRIEPYGHDPDDPHSLLNDHVNAILTDSRGRVWIGTDHGLSIYDEQKEQFQNIFLQTRDPAAPAVSPHEAISAVFEDRNGTLWLGTPGGLLRYDRSTGDHVAYPHRYAVFRYGWGIINHIAEDEAGHLWLATAAGLMRFTPKTGQYDYFQHDPQNPNSLSYTLVSSLYIDRTGVLWAGTAGQGVNVFDPKAGRFQVLRRQPDPTSRISGFSVRSILEDREGKVWISAEVLYRWDRQTGELKSFETHSNFPDDFGNTDVYSMIQDSDGFIWTAGIRGVFKHHPDSEHTLHFQSKPTDPQGPAEKEILAVFEDAEQTLWALGRYTLSRMTDREKGVFEHFTYQSKAAGELNHRAVLFQDANGSLWIAAATGLVRFDAGTRTFHTYPHDPADIRSLSSNHIKCIAADPARPRQFLWIGTAGGLNRLNLETRTCEHFSESDGLPNNVVYGILPDEEGHLWLSTNKGLSRFHPPTRTFRNFDVRDGLQSNEFNTGAFYRSPDGELFFGGIKGINYFQPAQIKDNPYPPRLAITGFRILEAPVSHREFPNILGKAISAADHIVLGYRDNVLSFEFAALDFSAPEKNQYAYRLDNFNEDWIYAGRNRTATYTNLAPGQYVFRVKAANNDGVWNEEGVSVRLTVRPPWWRTWWAYGTYTVLLALALYALRQYELKRFKLRNQLKVERLQTENLRKLDELKSRFFANISHEFRTPLTLIKGQLETVMTKTVAPDQQTKLASASHHADRLLLLINQLLDLSRLDAGKMELDLKTYDLASFLRRLLQAFQTQAEGMDITLQFHAEEEAVPARFDSDKMEKVFVNLIANALKFSEPGGRVALSVGTTEDRTIEIRVKDRGIGIPTDQLPHIFDRFYQADGSDTRRYEGSGIGLSIVYEYVKRHGGTIEAFSPPAGDPGPGTEFVIRLPRGETAGDLQPSGQAERSAAPITATIVETGKAVDREIILIVEDNPEVQAFIREQLEDRYQVMTAGNGREGIAASQAEIPDLIITDLMMPEMDGYDFSRRIKNDERTSHIPIIMLTAKAGLEHKLEGLETGIDAYLTKPFSVKELQVRVRMLIRERKRLRRRFASATIIKPSEVSVVPADQAFLEKALNIVEEHLDDEQFRVENLAEALHLSASQLNRKLNALVGQPGGQFIRSLRLQRAADLLGQGAGSVAGVAYQVGFTDQAYFARAFKKQFGCSPSEYGEKGI